MSGIARQFVAGYNAGRRRVLAVSRLLVIVYIAASAMLLYALKRLRARRPLPMLQRAHWLHRACARTIRLLGVALTATGPLPVRGLLVANHLSYLDIISLSALAPCVFVSKKEVRRWPVFGWMATLGGTIFIDRERRSDARRAGSEIVEALDAGALVVLFPEGTSSDGRQVLPFRPALFDAAVAAGHAIHAAHIRYRLPQGSVENEVCYHGSMTLFPHLLNLLGKPSVAAEIRFAPDALRFTDRRQAAEVTRALVLSLARP